MCGILGSVDRRAPEGVVEVLAHRGPDGRGEAMAHPRVWFGHTRLSILDLSPAGAQPMVSADGRWCITYNGEVYNHLDLRKGLDVAWRGHSDTETIVESLAHHGIEETLPKLNGMFAFAAMDRETEQLYVVRDPFGVKPVYYTEPGTDGWCFGSEIRALSALTGRRCEVETEHLATLLALRFVPAPHTLYRGIRKVPAGHVLRWDLRTGAASLHRYARTTSERFRGSFDDAVDAYGQVLRQAVRRQLLSDVPVGVLLSGGIDSALVAALAVEANPDVPTFSVGFGEGHEECELEAAAATAQALGLKNRGIRVGPEDLWTALEAVAGEVEEPLGTTSILPMWHLVRDARREVTVALTGQGSDEPWGGYFRYQGEIVRRVLPLPGLLRAAAPVLGWDRLPDSLRRALRSLPLSTVPARFEAAYELFSPVERRGLIGSEAAPHARTAIDTWLASVEGSQLEDVERMMRVDARMQLADDLLLYGDKTSMAVALEVRVPMLDLELVDFVESLPRRYKVRFRSTKRVHRALAEKVLPSEVVRRPKRGFSVPFRALCRGPWSTRVRERLLDGPHLTWLDRAAIERTWETHSHRADRSRQVFALLCIAQWARSHVGA